MNHTLLAKGLSFAAVWMTLACGAQQPKEPVSALEPTRELKDVDYRPNFHFAPEKHWMNDPNGMFYLDGTYHLFYQYYPDGNVWGPMHWGHATTKDLLHWQEKPIAIYPDSLGYIFSGSAVVDLTNSSGLGTQSNPPVVAMYTYHDPIKEREGRVNFQNQAIAYSTDQGATWRKYAMNPVIPNPGIKDFRDPKMHWDAEHQQWIVVLAVLDRVYFYTSQDLKQWTKVSEFGNGQGAHGGVWECPDFFPMPVAGTDETKWVLIQSLNPGAVNGGSGTQYFIGDFDGQVFTPVKAMQHLPEHHSYWLDFGRDNYAGVSWANLPKQDGRILYLGWMTNWQYAQEVPTETWRGAMTLPRELTLHKAQNQYRLHTAPARELWAHTDPISYQKQLTVASDLTLAKSSEVDFTKTVITFSIPDVAKQSYTFQLTSAADTVTFGYDGKTNAYFLDRSGVATSGFHPDFASHQTIAPRISKDQEIKVTLVLDTASLELFFDDGATVMTHIFFPKFPLTQLNALQSTVPYQLQDVNINQLKL